MINSFQKFFFLFFLLSANVSALENKIIYKINEEIVTSLDILSEIRYLKILNPNIKNLDEATINNVAKNSIIKEKIKKIEIKKNNNNFKIDNQYLLKLLENIYLRLNIKSIEEFEKYLVKNNIDFDNIKKKISIEASWNELIYSKFSNQLKINKGNLKEIILKDKGVKIKSYDLLEIVFGVSNKDEISSKYQNIKKDIETKGFSSAAVIHSISDTNKLGGKLGWINEKSIGKKIKDEIILLSEGEYTKPIIIPGGALILKINAIKEENIKLDLDKELNNLIRLETNKQLNQLSKLYYNKIKKNININEL